MRIVLLVVLAYSVSLMVTKAGSALAQNYPNKSVRIVAPGVGSSADFVARVIAQGISGPLGQQVIVDNRASIIAAETVAKAAPDGYTLIITGGTFWIGSLLQSTSYDPVRDFAPVAITNRQPNILVVHPSLPVKSVRELIALAKAKPGALNYAAVGVGGSGHLAAELFKSMAAVNIVHINYKLTASALTDVISGQVQLSFAVASTVVQHVNSGRLKALAVTSAKSSPLYPNLPTVAASGLPDYVAVGIYGAFVPIKTPATIVNRLNQEIVASLTKEDIKEKFLSAGIETVGSSPEELAGQMKSEMARLGKVIKEAGIRAE